MTQVQDMIDEKLDFALGDQLGWVNAWDGKRLVWIDGETNEFRRKVTDWHPSTDPAASLEVQAKAIEVDPKGYVKNLCFIKWGEKKQMGGIGLNYLAISRVLNASPRERAEAAYITLSSVKE